MLLHDLLHSSPTLAHRIALYVPSAVDLTRGGFFYRRGKSDTYDTIISAQHILKSMADSHAADLVKLALKLDASKQLLGVNNTNSGAAAASDAAAATAASGSSGGEVAVAAADGGDAQQQQAAGRKKGAKKGSSGPSSAADVEGTLMQLVVAGLTTDSDVSYTAAFGGCVAQVGWHVLGAASSAGSLL